MHVFRPLFELEPLIAVDPQTSMSLFNDNHLEFISMLESQSTLAVEEIINLHHYPINPVSAQFGRDCIQSYQTTLATYGHIIIKHFITSHALTLAQHECNQLSSFAEYSTRYTNPYKTDDDPTLPLDHPIRYFALRTNAFIAQHHFGDRSLFRMLYHSDLIKRFFAACLGLDVIYEYADPLGGLVMNVLPPGGQHPWHFDENDFSLVLMVQTPQQGGELEIAPMIRTPEAEQFEQVRQVLAGVSDRTKTIPVKAGDLVIFNGKRSLHRVTQVHGTKERHTIIFSYTQEPDVVARTENNSKIFSQ